MFVKRLLSFVPKNKKNFMVYVNSKRFVSDLYEPDYLEGMKSKIPLYDTINIQMRGYDYPILENFQKLAHNIVKNLEINVEETWAVPPQQLQITTFKPNSEIVQSKYSLKVYERTVQITDVSSLQMPILLRALETAAPAGVTIHVVPHDDSHEEVRYVPDRELITLKEQLDEMGGPRKTK